MAYSTRYRVLGGFSVQRIRTNARIRDGKKPTYQDWESISPGDIISTHGQTVSGMVLIDRAGIMYQAHEDDVLKKCEQDTENAR
jgi:hypothetical protein